MAKKRFRMNVIREVLDQRGVSQAKLARMLDMSNNTLSAYCRNERQPSLETLFEIAKLLNVDVNDLIGEGEEIREE